MKKEKLKSSYWKNIVGVIMKDGEMSFCMNSQVQS